MHVCVLCCWSEFVSLVSSESNDVSNREKRNTIHPDHVLKALHELGLQEFVREVTSTWQTWKEESKCRPTGADPSHHTLTPTVHQAGGIGRPLPIIVGN